MLGTRKWSKGETNGNCSEDGGFLASGPVGETGADHQEEANLGRHQDK